MKQRINNIFTAVLLLGISVVAAGCNTPAATAYTKISPAVTSKVTTTGKKLATDAPSDTVRFTFPDQGNIRVDGSGPFRNGSRFRASTAGGTSVIRGYLHRLQRQQLTRASLLHRSHTARVRQLPRPSATGSP